MPTLAPPNDSITNESYYHTKTAQNTTKKSGNIFGLIPEGLPAIIPVGDHFRPNSSGRRNFKRIGIVGGGRFGSSLAAALAERGVEVILLDRNREVVDDMAGVVAKAMEGDAT